MSRRRLDALLAAGPRVSPFLVLGDPTPELSVELARVAVDSGADILEIGFPYSDPVADGPAIQAADERALAGGTSTAKAMTVLRNIHDACPDTPLNLLVYGNLVHRRGFDRFCDEVAGYGASSLLVPDICLEESEPLRRAARRAKLGHVQLVGPLTSATRLKRIDSRASSFLYLVAHQGVTGVRTAGFSTEDVAALVSRTAHEASLPLCVGFGLSTPDQVRTVFDAGAKLAVVGSYLANVIAENYPRNAAALTKSFAEAFRPLAEAR